jgi:halocyanin-like protein
MRRTDSRIGRRRLLAGIGAAAMVGLAGCSGGGSGDSGGGDGGSGEDGGSGDGGATPEPTTAPGEVRVPDLEPVGDLVRSEPRERVDSFLSDVENYEGEIMDARGMGEVVVAVGAEGNGGAFAFEHPAVAIDAGTTVSWRWTGEGGQHNVVSQGPTDFEFSSGTSKVSGDPYEHTFDGAGVGTYVCEPHVSLGMKGAVVVISG